MAAGSPSESRTSKILSFLGGIKRGLLSLGKSVSSDGTRCVACKQELDRDLKGYQFCSQLCAANYWENFRQKHNSTSTKGAVCKLPGCIKLCYIEPDGRVHDFCGRGHAKEYQDLTGEIEKEKVRLSRVRLLSKSGSGEGTSYAVAAASSGSSCTRSGTVYGPTVSSQQRQFSDSHWRDNGTGPIRFYDRDALYYEFTNFYPVSIRLDDKDWPTTEHYFQAQKFVGTPFVEMIRRCTFPREAFDLSRNPTVSRWRRKDWDEVKIDVMRKALLAKFTQHDRLRRLLLSTGRQQLIEHTRNDSFWGDGGDGKGQNHLGGLLMEIRDVLLRNVGEKMPLSERESLLQKGSSTSRKDQSSFRSYSLDSEIGQSSAGQRDSASSSASGHAVVHTMSNNLPRRPLHEDQRSGLPSTPGHNVPVGVLVDVRDSRPPTEKQLLVVGITPTGSPALRPGQMIVFSDSSISDAFFSPNDIH